MDSSIRRGCVSRIPSTIAVSAPCRRGRKNVRICQRRLKFPIVPVEKSPTQNGPKADQREARDWSRRDSEAPFLSYQLESVERPGAVKGALVLRGVADP